MEFKMAICSQCKSEYIQIELVVLNPIPDKMCSECGSLLTDNFINNLTAEKNSMAYTPAVYQEHVEK